MDACIEQLEPRDVEPLRALLARDAHHNLYLLGLLEEFGVRPSGEAQGAFYGRKVGDELTAAVFVGGTGGLVVPASGTTPEVTALARGMGGKVRPQAIVGEKSSVDALVRALKVQPRVSAEQRLFAVSADDLGPFTNPTLRLAREDDIPALVQMAASAVEERTGVNPRSQDETAFRTRVERRVHTQRSYVLEVDGALVFKIDIGARSEYGAELEGLYTVPEQRRLGHATLSLGQISRHLLSSLPTLTLRVDEQTGMLGHIAQRVGFVARRSMRLVVVE